SNVLTPLQIGRLQISHEYIGKYKDAGKRVIDFVSNTRRQPSDGSDLFSLHQLHSGVFQLFEHPREFSKVGKYDYGRYLGAALLDDCSRETYRDLFTIFSDQSYSSRVELTWRAILTAAHSPHILFYEFRADNLMQSTRPADRLIGAVSQD